jgi:CRISPR-associated protein Cas4
MGGAEELVHAIPQLRGKAAHTAIDEKKYSSRKDEITGLAVYSNELGVAGKIDIYKGKEKYLIERKYQLHAIYRGQIYQLWAQYFCMIEMGYEVAKLAFYAIATNKTFPVKKPEETEKTELVYLIQKIKHFNPESPISTNENKCKHCIYCNLCDKIEIENVYT